MRSNKASSDIPIRAVVAERTDARREAIRTVLERDAGIHVELLAASGVDVVAAVRDLAPDVVVMGTGMSALDGLGAVIEIMAVQPTPIVIVGSAAEASQEFGLSVIRRGALDFVAARAADGSVADDLCARVKVCARVEVITHPRRAAAAVGASVAAASEKKDGYDVIGMAVSTGGPSALDTLLSELGADFPIPVVVVQHISDGFSHGLAEWLDRSCAIRVVEASDGEILEGGTVYIAPGGFHLTVTPYGRVRLTADGHEECVHKPSADVMLRSIAEVYGPRAIGLIMTGMGRDGVDGMRAIREAGGLTLAQDEKSSSLYGMNKIAVEEGWVRDVVPLDVMAARLVSLAYGQRRK